MESELSRRPATVPTGPATAVPIGLSTASVWPQHAEAAFGYAAELGYDGVEVMVWTDPASQDPVRIAELAESYRMPILAVHAPCLLITQRVWSPDPVVRLRRAVAMAIELDAPTVVVHPPFRWQLRYVVEFASVVEALEAESGVAIAVENMFGVRPLGRGRSRSAFSPSADPTDVGYGHYTLDLSHTAAAQMDAVALARRMGTGLTHLHLADGDGRRSDEHLVPGRGAQPCGEVCDLVAARARRGQACQVVVEVNTRRSTGRAQRAKDLAQALLFARLHFG